MDSQGTDDKQSSTPTIDNGILFLGLQLANVQLLNVRSPLQTQDLVQLHVSWLKFRYTTFINL